MKSKDLKQLRKTLTRLNHIDYNPLLPLLQSNDNDNDNNADAAEDHRQEQDNKNNNDKQQTATKKDWLKVIRTRPIGLSSTTTSSTTNATEVVDDTSEKKVEEETPMTPPPHNNNNNKTTKDEMTKEEKEEALIFSIEYATSAIFQEKHEKKNENTTKKDSSRGNVLLENCLQLFELNMAEYYRQSSWGYDPILKKEELCHAKAKFLFLWVENNDNDNDEPQEKSTSSKSKSSSSKTKSLAGFVHFRWELDDEEDPMEPVLYVYELQIYQNYQQLGLGKHFMELLEVIVQNTTNNVVQKIQLTCFIHNSIAMKFYLNKLQYTIDKTSPSQYSDSSKVDYEILSKRIVNNNVNVGAAADVLVAASTVKPTTTTKTASSATSKGNVSKKKTGKGKRRK